MSDEQNSSEKSQYDAYTAVLSRQITSNLQVLYFLISGYQGLFAALNVLGQLQSPDFRRSELDRVKTVLQRLNLNIASIKQGKLIFFLNPKNLEEERIKELDLVKEQISQAGEELRNELVILIEKCNKCLAENYIEPGSREIYFLLSAYACYTYSRDNYARGSIEIAKFNKDSKVTELEALQKETAREVAQTNDFMKAIKGEAATSRQFCEHLKFFCRILPGVFSANVYDLDLFLYFDKNYFSFSEQGYTPDYIELGFSPEEESAWSAIGFEAETAGYWKAYNFKAEEAILWLKQNFLKPKDAFEWQSAGFNPEAAKAWSTFLFSPLLAIQWGNAGFNPVAAAFIVSKGIHHPAQINPEQIASLEEEFREVLKKREEEFAKANPENNQTSSLNNNINKSDQDN